MGRGGIGGVGRGAPHLSVLHPLHFFTEGGGQCVVRKGARGDVPSQEFVAVEVHHAPIVRLRGHRRGTASAAHQRWRCEQRRSGGHCSSARVHGVDTPPTCTHSVMAGYSPAAIVATEGGRGSCQQHGLHRHGTAPHSHFSISSPSTCVSLSLPAHGTGLGIHCVQSRGLGTVPV